MTALLAIAGRELRERWTLPLAAFCFGFLILLPIVRHGEQALTIAAVATVPTAWVVAAITGATVIARDLADGRLAFFFARPVPWWAIAGGKLLAALVLTLATPLAAALPSLLGGIDGDSLAWFRDFAASGALANNLVLLLLVIGLAHAASVVCRSRERWAALDFVLAVLAIASGGALLRALTRWGLLWGGSGPGGGADLAGLLLLAALGLAPALVQVARGRSDLRRGHRALSITLWSGVLLLLGAASGFLAWQSSLGLSSFPSRIVTSASSDGRHLALWVARKGGGPFSVANFLLDTTSGHAMRFSSQRSWPAFSPDGGWAAWLEEPFLPTRRRDQVGLAALSGDEPALVTLELDAELPTERLVSLRLAPKAERIAIVQTQTLSVHELPSGRTLSRSTASDGEWMAAAFLPDGRLRALRRIRAAAGPVVGRPRPGFVEVVVFTGGVASSSVPLEAAGHAVLHSAIDADRVLLLEPQEALAPPVFSLHDASTGQKLRAFARADGWTPHDAFLLDAGGVAVLESDSQQNRLRLAIDAVPHRVVDLSSEGRARIAGEPREGIIAVNVQPPLPWATSRPNPFPAETVLVASTTGVIVRREPGLAPAGLPFGRPLADSPGAAGASLFVTSLGEIVRLDAATGERRVVLKAAAGQPPR